MTRELDFSGASLGVFLHSIIGLRDNDIGLLTALYKHLGETAPGETYYVGTRRELSEITGISASSVSRVLIRLAGVLAFDAAGAGRSARLSVLIDWVALRQLPRVAEDPVLESLRSEVERGSFSERNRNEPEVTASDRSGCTVKENISKPRVLPVSVSYPCPVYTQPAGNKPEVTAPPPDASRAPVQLRPLPSMPWSRDCGMTDDQLVEAVMRRDVIFLRHAYDELIRAEWVSDGPSVRQDFLTLVHHCARHRSLRRRVGTLVSKIRNGMDCTTCTSTSDDWAGIWLRPFDVAHDVDEYRQVMLETRSREKRLLSSRSAALLA